MYHTNTLTDVLFAIAIRIFAKIRLIRYTHVAVMRSTTGGIMRLSISIFDYFFVLRPTLFFAVWTVSLAGFWAQRRFAQIPKVTLSKTFVIGSYDLTYVLALALFTLVMGGVFLLNQIRDVDSDRFNKKLFLVANGDVSQRTAYIESIILVTIPLGLSFWLRPILGLTMLLTFVVTGWIYSLPPFEWKDRPLCGLVGNIMGYFLVFCTGWLINGNLELNLIIHALPYVLGITAVYFFTTVPDMEGDRLANKITFTVKYGVRNTIIIGLVFDIAAVLISVIVQDIVAILATGLSLPFFILTARSMSVEGVLRTNKFGTLFLSLIICFKFPGYFLLILLIFFASKWYYKKRFGINYPSFKSA